MYIYIYIYIYIYMYIYRYVYFCHTGLPLENGRSVLIRRVASLEWDICEYFNTYRTQLRYEGPDESLWISHMNKTFLYLLGNVTFDLSIILAMAKRIIHLY